MISTVKKVKEEIGEYRKERISARKPYKPKVGKSSLNHMDKPAGHEISSGRFRRAHMPSKLRLLPGKKQSSALPRSEGDHHLRLDDEGMDFKAKLIGIQDTQEARGDYMCQNAMQTCKTILKRSGHRKQRIWFNLSSKGFKIKERNSHIILFNFPINKISFIAKDITDDRAFGFVYEGLEKKKYKFYGIKTEQQAERIVLDIRDMFQMVYESTLTQKNQENKPAAFDRIETNNNVDSKARNASSLSSSHLEANSSNDQREYEEISPLPYEKVKNVMERTKSATEISQVDKLFAESNDLINFHHQTNNIHRDPFDFSPIGSAIQTATNESANEFIGLPTKTPDQFEKIFNNYHIVKQPDRTINNMDNFTTSPAGNENNSMPTIPPRPMPQGTILPRPESKQKNAGTDNKFLPPPLPKRNKNADQNSVVNQSENKDPFEDEFFA